MLIFNFVSPLNLCLSMIKRNCQCRITGLFFPFDIKRNFSIPYLYLHLSIKQCKFRSICTYISLQYNVSFRLNTELSCR